MGNDPIVSSMATKCSTIELRPHGGKWTESNLLPAGTAFTARRRHQPVLMALPVSGCGPRGCTGPSRAYETAWVPNRPTRGNDAKAFNSLAYCRYVRGQQNDGGCLTCRSPHLPVPSRFERAPEAALVRHPSWRKAAVSIRSGEPPDRFPSDADRPISRPPVLAHGGVLEAQALQHHRC